jgi:hypothetical protein
MIRRYILLALVASTGGALAMGAAAADGVTIVNAGPAVDSVKVVKDKDTGKLRAATPDEAAAMASQPAQRLAPNVVVMSRPATSMVSRADGSATIRRSVDDLDSVVAERGANGKMTVRHKGAPVPTTPNLPKE